MEKVTLEEVRSLHPDAAVIDVIPRGDDGREAIFVWDTEEDAQDDPGAKARAVYWLGHPKEKEISWPIAEDLDSTDVPERWMGTIYLTPSHMSSDGRVKVWEYSSIGADMPQGAYKGRAVEIAEWVAGSRGEDVLAALRAKEAQILRIAEDWTDSREIPRGVVSQLEIESRSR